MFEVFITFFVFINLVLNVVIITVLIMNNYIKFNPSSKFRKRILFK